METVLHSTKTDTTSCAAKVASAFFSCARRMPNKQAIWCEGRTATYQELADLVCRWSNAMAASEIKHGDHIGVILPNSVEFVALMMVAADLGAVLVPLNTALSSYAVRTAFEVANVKHVVSTAALLKNLLVNTNAISDYPNVNGLWLSVDAEIEGATLLADLLQKVPPNVQPLNQAMEQDAFILTMTSGSTGDPKPIVLTQKTKFNRVSAAVELYGISEHDRTLAATPLYHSLAERLVLIPLLTGGTSVLMSNFSTSTWLQCVDE
jgi:long-chain acyl-CoA synthetase